MSKPNKKSGHPLLPKLDDIKIVVNPEDLPSGDPFGCKDTDAIDAGIFSVHSLAPGEFKMEMPDFIGDHVKRVSKIVADKVDENIITDQVVRNIKTYDSKNITKLKAALFEVEGVEPLDIIIIALVHSNTSAKTLAQKLTSCFEAVSKITGWEEAQCKEYITQTLGFYEST